jgi:hypothetical protein
MNHLIRERLKTLLLVAPLGLGLVGVYSGLQGCVLVTRDPITTGDQSDLYGQKKPPVADPYGTGTDPYGTDPYDTDPYDTEPYGL